MTNIYNCFPGRWATGAFILAFGLYAGIAAAAAPDILDVRPGMSPADAYNALRAVDPTHRVTVAQIQIPELLGNTPAAYMMAPENLDTLKDNVYVNITLPPSPQQVWGVHRTLTGIHTTRDQIVASLLQKYGSNYVSQLYFRFVWAFTEDGQPANLSKADVNACEYRMGAATELNVPVIGPPIKTVMTSGHAPGKFPDLFDPGQFPQCQSLVWVIAAISGGDLNWILYVDITYPGLQHRTTKALWSFFNGRDTQQQQQNLNQAEHTAVPKL